MTEQSVAKRVEARTKALNRFLCDNMDDVDFNVYSARLETLRSALAADAVPVTQPTSAGCVGLIADTICKNVAELPDRNSPAGWPEAMLVTQAELCLIVTEALYAASQPETVAADHIPDAAKMVPAPTAQAEPSDSCSVAEWNARGSLAGLPFWHRLSRPDADALVALFMARPMHTGADSEGDAV